MMVRSPKMAAPRTAGPCLSSACRCAVEDAEPFVQRCGTSNEPSGLHRPEEADRGSQGGRMQDAAALAQIEHSVAEADHIAVLGILTGQVVGDRGAFVSVDEDVASMAYGRQDQIALPQGGTRIEAARSP